MIFHRSDKLFEDAARNPEQLDLLLARFRRIRSTLFLIFTVALIIVFGICVWLVIEGIRVLQSPNFDVPPYLVKLTAIGANGSLILSVILFSVFTGLMDAAMAADARVKSLLLFRAARESASSKLPVDSNLSHQ
jgi:hypothetical protein